MTIPLAILAACAVLLSVFGTPAWPWLESYLNGEPTTVEFARMLEPSFLKTVFLSVVIVAAGMGAAWVCYGKPGVTSAPLDPIEVMNPTIFSTLRDKFYIDELYQATVLRLNGALGWFSDCMDRYLWNGIVKVISILTLGFAWVNRFLDEFLVNGAFDEGCQNVRRSSGFVASLQSGQIQKYLRVIGVTLTVLLLMLMWGCR